MLSFKLKLAKEEIRTLIGLRKNKICQSALTYGKNTRPDPAKLWGYAGYEAISRGAVTPHNTPYIILFINREKQEFLTQYEDQLVNGILEMEGETMPRG